LAVFQKRLLRSYRAFIPEDRYRGRPGMSLPPHPSDPNWVDIYTLGLNSHGTILESQGFSGANLNNLSRPASCKALLFRNSSRCFVLLQFGWPWKRACTESRIRAGIFRMPKSLRGTEYSGSCTFWTRRLLCAPVALQLVTSIGLFQKIVIEKTPPADPRK
jgi:hypothetical protein